MMSHTEGGKWNIPPPPGTESTNDETTVDATITSLLGNYLSYPSLDVIRSTDSLSESVRAADSDISRHKYTRGKSPSRHRWRNKEDRPRDYYKRHKHKKRSRSRSHEKRKRFRSQDRRRGQCSRSRSRSHNRSSSRRRHREKRHKHSSLRRSKSRSRSKSVKHHRHRPYRSHSSRSSHSHDSEYNQNVTDGRHQSGGEDDDDTPTKENVFKNDGSFLEMFKKMQEEQKVADEAAKKANLAEVIDKSPIPPPVGKRRGGRVLKTGMVQKARTITENDYTNPQDAWSVYMKEVKRYKEACCDDDSKTRPLVK